jgi:hypothetical protein
MKANTHSQQESRRTHPFNANHFQGKTRIVLGLCVLLGTGLISVHAADGPAPAAARVADTPVQATARAALEQKMNELNRPQTLQTPRVPRALRLPGTITPFGIEKKPRSVYAAISLEKC